MEISPQQWDRVKELYEVALEGSASQREEILRRSGSDPIVLEELRRLLAEHQNLGDFLTTAALERYLRSDEPSQQRFQPGQVLSARFRVVRFVAAGGMGEVYEAVDLTLEESLAIKTIRPGILQHTSALERFKREVHLARQVTHPNVCRVFDLFSHEAIEGHPETVFVSMELLRGETLAERMGRNGRFTATEARPLISQIAAGLEAAHREGIVHGDLKPGNVVLVAARHRNEIRCVITDFGLAIHAGVVAPIDADATATVGLIGTPAYMAPEQVKGQEATKASDIYALGLIVYEMVSGRHPFAAETPLACAAKRLTESAVSPRKYAPELSEACGRAILRCLEREPSHRFSSASDFAVALSGEAEALVGLLTTLRRPVVLLPILALMLVLVGVSLRLLQLRAREQWARNEALPQVSELVEKGRLAQGYTVAAEAERFIPDDPALRKLWPSLSWTGSITTSPPGAAVFRRAYNSLEAPWEFVGNTPVSSRRFPLIDSEWKVELAGYRTVYRATFPADNLKVTMEPEDRAPSGMVHVEFPPSPSNTPRLSSLFGIAGFENIRRVALGDYWIDTYEVSNRQFKEFLDQGGYANQKYWKHEFVRNGRKLTWSEAIALFRDRTGRPGPATWIQGGYAKGEDDLPVTGVSWYEAAAYAEFRNKLLPTIYHWRVAAGPDDGGSIIPGSNFGSVHPAPVGSYHSMSWSGAYDMAGNVKEWVLNEATPGKRYILGGAWNEPTYMFNDADARSPFDRSANFGFRCSTYSISGDAVNSTLPIEWETRNFSVEKPASDEVFRAYRSLYTYDKTPLSSVLDSREVTADWIREKVSFAAAYGNERVTAYLFLPRKSSPPFQAVIYFPGADALRLRSSENLTPFGDIGFILRSGRAVLFPIYKGTFERGDGMKTAFPNTSSTYRDHVIAWSRDLGRSIDYLESRPDIDHNKLGYEGASWGAAMGAVFLAVEPRIKVAVLLDPGFYLQLTSREVDQLNFAPHVNIPVLMLNARFDYMFPPPLSQEPLYRFLGTPEPLKRRVLADTGHDFPQDKLSQESLDWLDRHLGPVR